MNEEVEILVIEDTRADAEMTIRAIKKTNISNNIVHLKDGLEALDFLFGVGNYSGRDTTKKPKVILLDLKMPKMSGLQVLEKLKQDPHTKGIPVVVLTSSRESPDVEKAYALGVNSYIVKPVDSTNFAQVVSDLGLYWISHNQLPDQ